MQAHAAKSKQDMTAFEKYDQPRLKVVVTPNKQALGKTFKRQAKAVQEALELMQVCVPAHASGTALPSAYINVWHMDWVMARP